MSKQKIRISKQKVWIILKSTKYIHKRYKYCRKGRNISEKRTGYRVSPFLPVNQMVGDREGFTNFSDLAKGIYYYFFNFFFLSSSGLLAHFRMDPTDVLSFFRLVERGYHAANPYHNALHACDVTQAMFVFCRQAAIRPHLTPLDLLAALVAAVGHDLDHPGVNEKFLVSTGSHLAVLYDNVSVLENHHWRSAVSCFVEAGLARYLTDAQLGEFTDLVRALILATDISRQQEFLAQFRYVMDSSSAAGSASTSSKGRLDLLAGAPHQRHFILQIAIKCADISNPCRAWPVSRLWSLRACEEFFRQGDRERELGAGLGAGGGVTPICDRFNVTVAKVQVGFYTFVVEPLFREWHRFLGSHLSATMLASFAANQQRWEAEVLHEDEHLSSGDDEADDDDVDVDNVIDENISCRGVEVMTVGEGQAAVIKRVSTAVAAMVSKPVSVGLMSSSIATSSCLDRRMSLPSSHPHHRHSGGGVDPLHRIFDQMLQPDATTKSTMLLMTSSDNSGGLAGGTGGGSVSLRRNYSLTERRRSSLLRGLYTRSSLKPTGGGNGNVRAGRLSRPTSACLETASESSAPTTGGNRTGGHPPRTLQPMENRLDESAALTGGMDLSSGGGGGGSNFGEEQNQQQLLAVMKKNLVSSTKDDNNDNDDDSHEMMMTTMMMMRSTTSDREKENSTSGGGGSFHLYQRLTQRRGSAPSNLVLGESSSSKVNSCCGLVRQQSITNSCTNRRGSLPSELLADSLPKQLRNRLHAASGGKSKGLLRRRSMGPEMLLTLNHLHQHHHPKDPQRPQLVQKYLNRPF